MPCDPQSLDSHLEFDYSVSVHNGGLFAHQVILLTGTDHP